MFELTKIALNGNGISETGAKGVLSQLSVRTKMAQLLSFW
jgi:hypothetical protein